MLAPGSQRWCFLLKKKKRTLCQNKEETEQTFSCPKGRSVHFVWKDQAINKTSFAKHGTEGLSVNVAHALWNTISSIMDGKLVS